ncbi:hypothetical protein GOP47_0028596 [Adiantum capillus-veneris]|nr:hypothetical protein GOP47_0028596 [Adiantum capillus-veneris]
MKDVVEEYEIKKFQIEIQETKCVVKYEYLQGTTLYLQGNNTTVYLQGTKQMQETEYLQEIVYMNRELYEDLKPQFVMVKGQKNQLLQLI